MYLPLVENFVLSIKHHIEEMDIINDNNEPL